MINSEPNPPFDLSLRNMTWCYHLPGDIILSHMMVQVTDSCPYNQCAFCYTYKSSSGYPRSPFRIIPLEEVFTDFEQVYNGLSAYLPPEVFNKKAFLCDADSLVRPAGDISAVLQFLYSFKPIKETLKTVASYARADTIIKKEPDLHRLKIEGLTDIYLGIESGSDNILKVVNKGYSTEEIRESVMLLNREHYKVHAFVVSGLGGKERTEEHAQKTAEFLNGLSLDTIIVSPLTISGNTSLGQRCKDGSFQPLSKSEKIAEETKLVGALNLTTKIRLMGCFRCSEIGVEGDLPEEKDRILAWLRNEAEESRHYLSCAPEAIG